MSSSSAPAPAGWSSAIAAREKGASVLIVEKNFDIGGRAMMSFGGLYIGGGNRLQKAIGMAGHARQGVRGLVAPREADGPLQRPRSSCAPMPTTISICSIGWRSTASSGKATAPRPIVSIASRTRLNVVPWPNEVTGPGARLRLRAAAGEDRARDGHRDPAAAADDENPPRGAAVGARDRHLGRSRSTTDTSRRPRP